jgi:hypothetical protein
MTRVKISVGILCVMVGMSIFFTILINRKCSGFIKDTETIWEYYEAGDFDEAYRESEKLEDEWESFRSYATVLMHNGKLTEIDRISSRIVYLVENRSEELHSDLTELKHMIESIKKGEVPVINSVL